MRKNVSKMPAAAGLSTLLRYILPLLNVIIIIIINQLMLPVCLLSLDTYFHSSHSACLTVHQASRAFVPGEYLFS